MKVLKYYREGFVKSRASLLIRLIGVLIKKSIFFTLYFWIPMTVLGQEWYVALLMLLVMLFVSGVVMTTIFQTAHVVPGCDFVDPEKAPEQVSWHLHQLRTTANFAKGNQVVTQVLGGLNYQIEHHLFPGICHVYYPRIAPIVERTAKEFGMPYHENSTLWSTIRGHFRLLKEHGR